MLRGTSLLIVGLMGAAFFAQAPEFAQQYRQRLGGAVEELRRVVVLNASAPRRETAR